jgi:hypothetical protein
MSIGNVNTCLISELPTININKRSKPNAMPEHSGNPASKAAKKRSSIG